jgi:hypothetical protein
MKFLAHLKKINDMENWAKDAIYACTHQVTSPTTTYAYLVQISFPPSLKLVV